MSRPLKRMVICLPSDDHELRRLPSSQVVNPRWIYGGVRGMHELAFAAAAAGHDVELRGWIDQQAFDELKAASGVSPRLEPAPRVPERGDVIILPEGHASTLPYARPWLSPAQVVLLVLAPLGLCGWPFAAGWKRPSPLTVSYDEVDRAEDYRTLAAMGIVVWSNAQVIVDAAGVHGSFLGNGVPMEFPALTGEKTVDVAWLLDNRWAPFARELAEQLGCTIDAIESTDHSELMRRFERAKILLYPARIEGESRIAREARAMGMVPVVPRANPIASKLEAANGVIAVDEMASIPAAISALLADPAGLAVLSERARATARADAAWEPYVARITAALGSLPEPDRFAGARAEMGAEIQERLDGVIAAVDHLRPRVAELEAELARSGERNVELEVELDAVRRRKDEAEVEIAELQNAERQLRELRSRRSVRWSTAAADFVRRNR